MSARILVAGEALVDLLLTNLADNGGDLGYAVEVTEPASLAVVTLGAAERVDAARRALCV